MIPGVNPRQMQRAMKQMGIQQEEIDAHQVIIRLADKDIVIENPSVQKVKMMGQESYQISGEEIIRDQEVSVEINADDIETVMQQANVDENTAKKALEDNEGDLAAAIVSLK